MSLNIYIKEPHGRAKAKAWVSIVGVLVMLMLSAMIFVQRAHAQYSTLDPPNPSSRFILEKLNDHIAKEELLVKDMETLRSGHVLEKLAVIESKQDATSSWTKVVVAGILTVLVKEIIGGVKVIKPRSET